MNTTDTPAEPVLQPMMDWAELATTQLQDLGLFDDIFVAALPAKLEQAAAIIRSSLTDAAVAQWVKERQAEMDDPELQLTIFNGYDNKVVFMFGQSRRLNGHLPSGPTLAEAKREYWRYVKTPQERAKQKRDEAQKLILEANLLEQEAT